MESILDNQVDEVLPYQFEPEPGLQTSNSGDDSDSEEDSASSEEEVDHVLEAENAWRLESLSWCKCGHCTLKPKAIESFCCHEKALEYDEYDALLKEAETQGEKCLTTHAEFKANMLSDGVLKIDVCRYLEDNWSLAFGQDSQTLQTRSIPTMFALGVSDFGEEEQKATSCVCLHNNSRTIFSIL